MSTETDNTSYQVQFNGLYEIPFVVLDTVIDGWTEEFLLQLAEALATLTFPEGCSIKVQKLVDVLTTYDADTTVSPAVFD